MSASLRISIATVLGEFEDGVRSLDLSFDGSLIAAGFYDGIIRLWDTRDLQMVRILQHPVQEYGHVYGLAFSPDGILLASTFDDSTLSLWDIEAGSEIKRLVYFPEYEETVESEQYQDRFEPYSVKFNPSGEFLACGAMMGHGIKIWDVKTSKEVLHLKLHSSHVVSLSYSPDGKILASGGDDNMIGIWNLVTGAGKTLSLPGTSIVETVVFNHDGAYLAAGGLAIQGSQDAPPQTLHLLDPTTMHVIKSFQGSTPYVLAAAFHPSGTLLASGHTDGTIALWDVSSQELLAVAHCGEEVRHLRFSPDGRMLVSGGGNSAGGGHIELWHLALSDTIQT